MIFSLCSLLFFCAIQPNSIYSPTVSIYACFDLIVLAYQSHLDSNKDLDIKYTILLHMNKRVWLRQPANKTLTNIQIYWIRLFHFVRMRFGGVQFSYENRNRTQYLRILPFQTVFLFLPLPIFFLASSVPSVRDDCDRYNQNKLFDDTKTINLQQFKNPFSSIMI